MNVIVSDIAMRAMAGIQLLREVRTHELRGPVVLITAEPALSTAVQALEYGAFQYLTNPWSPRSWTLVARADGRLSRAKHEGRNHMLWRD